MPPFAVEDFASIAVMMDTAGAAVDLFQSGAQIGAGIVCEPGSMDWFELLTEDRSGATTYYRSVFGWRTEQDRIKQECTLFVGDSDLPLEWRYTGGLDDGPPAWLSSASLWLVYFQVADIDASVQLALELGARVQEGIKSGPMGHIARLLDPQGVPFGLAQAD